MCYTNKRKGGRKMRKAFTTSVEENIVTEFKANCAMEGIPMNKVLELLMSLYNSGRLKVEINGYFDDSTVNGK